MKEIYCLMYFGVPLLCLAQGDLGEDLGVLCRRFPCTRRCPTAPGCTLARHPGWTSSVPRWMDICAAALGRVKRLMLTQLQRHQTC